MINMRSSALAKLPTEILAMVFEMACAVDIGKRFTRRGDLGPWRNRGAINLTCAFWRQVALRTPSLWSDLVICAREGNAWMSDVPEDEKEDKISRIDPEFIPIVPERAGAAPLNTHVFCNDRFSVKGFWNAILPYVTRTVDVSRTIDIKLPYLCRPLGILSKPHPLPKLRYLLLEWGDEGLPKDVPTTECIDLSQATSIVLLSISVQLAWGISIFHHTATITLRLRLPEMCMLKELRLTGKFAIEDVISAVTCCASSLERLTLDIDATFWEIEHAQDPPELQLVCLRHFHGAELLSFTILRTMNAPKLMSLTIQTDADWDWSFVLPKTQQFPALLQLRMPLEIPKNILMTYLVAHPTLQTVGPVNIAIAQKILLADNSKSLDRLFDSYLQRCCNASRVGGAPPICGSLGVTAEHQAPFGGVWEPFNAEGR
jgi:hypothetical protein